MKTTKQKKKYNYDGYTKYTLQDSVEKVKTQIVHDTKYLTLLNEEYEQAKQLLERTDKLRHEVALRLKNMQSLLETLQHDFSVSLTE